MRQRLIFRYRTTIFDHQSLITHRHEFRQTFSKVKKGVKVRFKGRRHNRDKRGPGTSGEATDLEESRSRSESPFVLGGGDRDLEESSGSNPTGEPIGSTDRPAQLDESNLMSLSLGERKPDAADGREMSRTLINAKAASPNLCVYPQTPKH